MPVKPCMLANTHLWTFSRSPWAKYTIHAWKPQQPLCARGHWLIGLLEKLTPPFWSHSSWPSLKPSVFLLPSVKPSTLLASSVLPIKSESEILWVRVILQAQPDLIVKACYQPHVSDQTTIPALTSNADEILAESHKNMIIGGECWPTPGFHRIYQVFGFSQLIDEPTILHNTLDLLLTNIPERINITKVLLGISDHNIPFTELSLPTNRRKQATRKIYLYKQADWEGLNKHIQPFLEPLVCSRSPVEEIWEKFKVVLEEAADKYIPTKITKSHPSRPRCQDQTQR